MSSWIRDGKLPDVTQVHGAFQFVVGTILNQNISGELAWLGVDRLSHRLDLRPAEVVRRSTEQVESALRERPAIHPFSATMARAIREAAERVCRDYAGDARLIWRTAGGPLDLIDRLTRFRQIGTHKAEVAAYLLTAVYGECSVGVPFDVTSSCPALVTYLGG